MKPTTEEQDRRMANYTFASIFSLYLQKVERKGRTREELITVLSWLTGYTAEELMRHAASDETLEAFWASARLHPHACLIKGVICGYRVEEIANPLTQQIRYMDKLVDELAKGKALERILR